MKKAKLKRENARMKRNGYKMLQSDTAKFKIYSRNPMYGMYFRVHSIDAEVLEEAKQFIYERSYKPLQARLRKFAGTELKEPKWIVHAGDFSHMPTVGWKAKTDKPVSQNAHRRMDMAEKRARMQIDGKQGA